MIDSVRSVCASVRERVLRALGRFMSLNDPQWGRRPGSNQGPPDLDELWRNFRKKLDRLLGSRRTDGGGGDEEPPVSNGKKFGGGAGILIGLVVLVWLGS